MALCSAPADAAASSAERIYDQAIRTMAQVPEPPFVSYRVIGQGQQPSPLKVTLVEDGGLVWLRMSGGDEPVSWGVMHRSSDYASTVADDAKIYGTDRSFFDPTWYGAYHALHDGMFFVEHYDSGWQPKPRPIATPVPSPEPTSANLRTIALLRVMGPQIYRITDDGAAQCDNGDPGRALRIEARFNPEAHQLRAAVVDLQSMRFCMLRFSEPDLNDGTIEQHYATVGGFWVQTGGIITFRFAPPRNATQPYSVADMPLVTWRYRFEEMQFPASIPGDFFPSAPK